MKVEKTCKFVILWHAMPSVSDLRDASRTPSPDRISHFDLMLEDSEHLVTFELPKIPIPGERIQLFRLRDHRLHFLEFEGTLDPGPNEEERGFVTRWTAGSYHIYRWAPQKLIVELTSPRLSARIVFLPGTKDDGVIETRSTRWPGVIRWELRVPRWEVKEPV